MKDIGTKLGWLAVVLAFGLLSGAAWTQFMEVTAALSYAIPIRIMVVGVVTGGLAFALNHSPLVQAAIPKQLRLIAGILFGLTSMVMGWMCTFTAFPSGVEITDVGARIACAVVAFSVGLYSHLQTGSLIRNCSR